MSDFNLSKGVEDMDDLPNGDSGGSKGSNKRLSVERIYQKKTQLEHILLRPDSYIGSVEFTTQPMWVYDEDAGQMIQREISFVPGLYKIFDEILVNAADNKQRDDKMNCIKIDIDSENNRIKIWNNGKGIPTVMHQKEKVYVPTLVFGHLLTGSNYDDTEKKVTGGRNGYGAKLCNIFSTKFSVETSCKEYGKHFKQSWTNNMAKHSEPKVVKATSDDFTCVTFSPDLTKFKMDSLDKDIVDLFSRRAYDIAASSKGVKVFLNGKKVNVKDFKSYIDLFIKGKVDDAGNQIKLVHEQISPRWEIAVTVSDKGFQQVSFANSIATTKGGRHVDYITDMVIKQIIENVKKKDKKGSGINIKPFQVKNHIWVFVNCLIENPTFDSQTKENMTLQAKSFGSKATLSDRFITMANRCGIVESIMSWMRFKQQQQLGKKMSATKTSKLKGLPKLDDANDAGTKYSTECTLILTEGDSAKTMAVSGLSVVGRDKYGVFPLRGKMLNVREASHKQIMDNAEINNVIKIIGLQYKEKYENSEDLKRLRYGKVMVMTDQDQDGSHIKGLFINFIHNNWPNLLKHRFVEQFITPIVKVKKGKESLPFYSLPEFEEWKAATDNWRTWKTKYYKGLGTSTAVEAKEYFSDMHRHRIRFDYKGVEDDQGILLAFSKKKTDDRKEWLTNWMEERKRRALLGLPELYLYNKDTKSVTFNEFINRELILFSNTDNERSIPSLVDGLKPGQRKVLYACLKRNMKNEVKVAQLAGSVAELSAYHHGENSLMGTIINLAQNFCGSNNLNLLKPVGQFGTRLQGGKDHASPRYIFTQLSTLCRHVMNVNDDPLLKSNFDDNQRIEPVYYVPIIPMVLINGADGIGTGWSTKINNYDIREVVNNIRRMIDGEEPNEMLPSYKWFSGTVENIDENRYVCNGEVSILDETTVEITELPVKTWTQAYKENVLEPMLNGTDKTPPFITDYKEYHTDMTVKFIVKMSAEKLAQAEADGLHKVFKLQSTMATTSMVLFDSNGVLRKYESVDQILREFYELRVEFYQKRKEYLEGMLSAESLRLDNIARFIMEKIDGTIVVENKPKKEIIQMLTRRGFDSDPVKTWKEEQTKLQALQDGDIEIEDDDDDEADAGPDYNYLMTLPMWSLTKEKKEELMKQRDAKSDELYKLQKKTKFDLYRDDLNEFLKELQTVEAQEIEDASAIPMKKVKGSKGRVTTMKNPSGFKPSPHGRRVEPRIDAALRAKVAAAGRLLKKKQDKKEDLARKLEGGEFNDDEDDEDLGLNKSLTDRLGSLTNDKPPAKEKKEKKPRKPREPREPKEPKERKTSPKKGKGGKKRNPWSDESDASDNVEDNYNQFSDSDDDNFSKKEKTFAERVAAHNPRRAAVKSKYTFSSGEESDEDDKIIPKQNTSIIVGEENGDNNDWQGALSDDSDFGTTTTATTAASNKKIDSESGEEDEWARITGMTPTPTKAQKKAPPPAAAASSRPTADPVFSISDDDDDLVVEKEPVVSKPAVEAGKKKLGKKVNSEPKPKKGKAKTDPKQPSIFSAMSKVNEKTKPSKVALDDSEDDIIIEDSPPNKEPKPKAAPKRKKKVNLSDSDDEAPKKTAKKSKKAAKPSWDDDSDDDFLSKKKSKKKADSDSDINDMDLGSPVMARATTGRARKAVSYNFGADDSEEDEDY